jgi:hypothetical protein
MPNARFARIETGKGALKTNITLDLVGTGVKEKSCWLCVTW